jgi:hypothetical protein
MTWWHWALVVWAVVAIGLLLWNSDYLRQYGILLVPYCLLWPVSIPLVIIVLVRSAEKGE